MTIHPYYDFDAAVMTYDCMCSARDGRAPSTKVLNSLCPCIL